MNATPRTVQHNDASEATGTLGPVPGRVTPAPNTWATREPWHAHALAPDAPAYAVVSQHVARTLADALTRTGDSLRSVAATAGVDHGTVSRILAGHTVPDVATLAALEDALSVNLWPIRH